VIVIAGRPQHAVHAGGDDRQPSSRAIFRSSSVRVGPSVRTSTKSFFSDFDLIWCVGRLRPDMRIMTSTRSKIKVKVTGLLNFRKLHFSLGLSPPPFWHKAQN